MISRYPVYLIDDDDAVREGLSLLFRAHQMTAVTFADPQSFLAQVNPSRPGFLLVDLKMPQVSGMDLHQRLLERGINWPLAIITGHGDVAACRSAFKSGAADFLTKPVPAETLFASISAMESQLDAAVERQGAEALLSTLTPRESEILDMICLGLETKEIANALNISHRTVDSHRVNISTKLGTSSIAELVRMVRST
ncbi:LuxR family transcriptional regulator [Bradyrhizobium sp. LTSPM299]|uniref:response regulator transcription factor n=1 Tax=Bradyrhizobium sp. LTSPM299 TaxID=1619233 RepID=UPI0005C9BBCF|nr:response regulator [Bradyrhizobium sp. LTSPM299]KJC53895.1 LuxR family transcriptional regulator [Bradyrhizobium sp. LTSPM299]